MVHAYIVCTILAVRIICASANAATLTALDRGWYDNTGFHDPTNDNYIVGDPSQTGPDLLRLA
jgi:hypothetical protein